MTDARHDADLAAIKAQEQEIRDAINRGEPVIDMSGNRMAMTRQQLGLREVVADANGRMWRCDRDRLTLLSGPRRAFR